MTDLSFVAIDRVVHRALEQNRTDDLCACEILSKYDAGAHRVHGAKHLFVAGVLGWLDAVEAQRLWCRSARLVQRRDEARA